jgi:hypothetical protein
VGAEKVLAKIVKAIPDQARGSMTMTHLQNQSMQLWKDVVASGEFAANILWIHRARIMACCVQIVLGKDPHTPSYEAILGMVDEELDDDDSDDWIVAIVERIVAEKSCGGTRKSVRHLNPEEAKKEMIKAWTEGLIAGNDSENYSNGPEIYSEVDEIYSDSEDEYSDDESINSDVDEVYSEAYSVSVEEVSELVNALSIDKSKAMQRKSGVKNGK